jgi:hypothetical protein
MIFQIIYLNELNIENLKFHHLPILKYIFLQNFLKKKIIHFQYLQFLNKLQDMVYKFFYHYKNLKKFYLFFVLFQILKKRFSIGIIIKPTGNETKELISNHKLISTEF